MWFEGYLLKELLAKISLPTQVQFFKSIWTRAEKAPKTFFVDSHER